MGRIASARSMRPCEDAHRESRLNPALAAALTSALSALCWVILIEVPVLLL
jgi:hypothetical protein